MISTKRLFKIDASLFLGKIIAFTVKTFKERKKMDARKCKKRKLGTVKTEIYFDGRKKIEPEEHFQLQMQKVVRVFLMVKQIIAV